MESTASKGASPDFVGAPEFFYLGILVLAGGVLQAFIAFNSASIRI